ncbi:GTPase-activating protein CdGAPr isoform X2 [Teleopsis dalmanni]|uniref:GTPase-activating protein CdGAPr isoform X2 n=1 Tax=Teleopsis dalmanni TaxID=139649 RepID=UPI000D32A156|nr:GTPase-activating protein CdGAPr isoform X2 [Teleopsis dalmanni]
MDSSSDKFIKKSSSWSTSMVIPFSVDAIPPHKPYLRPRSEPDIHRKVNKLKKHVARGVQTDKSCRFPKLEECAHFHYERVQLGPLSVRLVDDKSELLSSIASQSIGGDIAGNNQMLSTGTNNATGQIYFRSFSASSCWFIIKVIPQRCDPFLVKRSFDNMQMLDEMLHRCVYDRKISGLKNLKELDFKSEEDVEYAVAKYLERFSKIASDSLTCGTILTWLQLDNKGRRLPLADGDTMRSINTPAVGAAYGVRRYQAQASDEISIEVGDMISVIDMPSPAESIWWRGKKSHLQKSHYEVGFFPQACVATIGDKVPRHFPMPAPLVGQLDVSPTKPVLRKHGKLIAFFRSFILSRPSRRRLKQSGIYRERVFSCDLSEHLLNSGQEIPMVLKCCSEFIEDYGIVDGIYRLSGITSNIQRLRRAFDEERIPDLGNPEMKQDIHAVSSLLKMYFRELPNPLCTYQLYDNFVEAIQAKSESNERLRLMKETVLKLPPPHYRTLKYLSEHLNKISQHAARTGMTDKNLAIVWAPNLLRSPALESGGVAALRGVGVQAVVTEYLIRNCHHIFDALEDTNARLSYIATAGAMASNEVRLDSLTDCESLLVEQREHDQSLTFAVERPKSLSASGPKLISLEEAQERHSRLDGFDMKQSMPINMVSSNAANIGSYIEVGGGPSSLPDKYHTVLSVPRSWQKRKTHSWKSLFTRNQRTVGNNGTHDLKSTTNGSNTDTTPPHHKQPSQVTFAESDAIVTNAGKVGKSLMKQDKPKSIELFDTSNCTAESCKPMEVCVRSNSIDSLRTTGHSRSVSHDSYFDLLQSPQRGHMTTCPSRELSELGLNFDREEPEMRIFSESESLVSSPRVGKENIPPSSGAASRRIMRARPEEFSSQTNSVNPSPKKQPRLNLLLSPSAAAANTQYNWSQTNAVDGGSADSCQEHTHLSSDESCCKRYKLEDQLSDIQYIDCSTPEHTIANPQTLYTSVQVHAPPKSTVTHHNSKDSAPTLQDTTKDAKVAPSANTRYSYPSVQLGAKRKEQESEANVHKERFSYPGSNVNSANVHSVCSKEPAKMLLENETFNRKSFETTNNARTVSFVGPQSTLSKSTKQQHMPKVLPDLLRPKNRNSFCGTNEQLNLLLLRSNSADISKDAKIDMERSKLSVTPSSPVRSPRYSLLVGETSSENSSAVNTPQYDLDPLMVESAMSGLSCISGTSSNQQQQFLLGVDASSSYLGTSHESLGSNLTSHSNNISTEKRDMHALKRELSLDLNPLSTKMTIDRLDNGSAHTNKQLYQQQPSPNNSNFTDNTSQSVTPSEFGYQHLQRQSSMHSLIETEESSPVYDDFENTPSNVVSPLSANKLPSPIKSTISITFNKKGNSKEEKQLAQLHEKPQQPKPLLETSFDEHTVYVQVKLFRNSVTEVNQLLDNDNRKSSIACDQLKGIEETSELEDLLTQSNGRNQKSHESIDDINSNDEYDDIQMGDEMILNNSDCDDFSEEKLLYENVELRKPKSIYENILGEDMKIPLLASQNLEKEEYDEESNVAENGEAQKLVEVMNSKKNKIAVETNNLRNSASKSYQRNLEEAQQSQQTQLVEQENTARKSPSNFSVKELATKFECSPVEQLPAFDFSLRCSMKKPTNQLTPETKVAAKIAQATNCELIENNVTTSVGIATNGGNVPPNITVKPKLKKSEQITRSLDENAFVREFGTKHVHDMSAKSIQQLPELTEVCNRRKSFDFTRPKTLNPPKRLPGMPITEETCMFKCDKTPMKLELHQYKEKNYNHTDNSDSAGNSIENDYESSELKITPTTENRISLIQNNVALPNSAADLNNSNLNLSNSSLKVLSGVKLDRERIDKIKEERRQQLTQKYRTESFKSKSKIDLHTTTKDDVKFQAESLRMKSKSRGDIRTLQKDLDNLKDFRHVGSESTLNAPIYTHRVRSISDEKNQNSDVSSIVGHTELNNANNSNNTITKNSKKIHNTNNHINVASESNNGGDTKLLSAGDGIDVDVYPARTSLHKIDRKNNTNFGNVSGGNVVRERKNETGNSAITAVAGSAGLQTSTNRHVNSTREKISPQFSIRDVTAMFESRSQNQ